jgi:hypothetical protein
VRNDHLTKVLRRRCRHPNRVEFRDGWQRVYRDMCPDCGAEFPVERP